jgi:hypothetical protein
MACVAKPFFAVGRLKEYVDLLGGQCSEVAKPFFAVGRLKADDHTTVALLFENGGESQPRKLINVEDERAKRAKGLGQKSLDRRSGLL